MHFLKLIFLVICFKVFSQKAPIICSNNDPVQNIPLWNAISNGSNAVTIPIEISNKKIYTKNNLDVEDVYLIPLEKALKLKQLKSKNIYLVFEIKNQVAITVKELSETLAQYPVLTNSEQLKLVVSVPTISDLEYETLPDFLFLDGKESTILEGYTTKIALLSLDFKAITVWNGKGRLTAKEEKKVLSTLAKARKYQKPIRFINAPDSKTAWKLFYDLGLDFIETKKNYLCVEYIKGLSHNYVNSNIQSKIYIPKHIPLNEEQKLKNIILMIGDGNGLAQISASSYANGNNLTLTQLKHIGLIKTHAVDNLATDSAAAGTAMATGVKTNNRAIGVDKYGNPVENITEILHKKGFVSGCITTDRMVGATPSAFYAHQKDRSDVSNIATDLSKSKFSLFIGAGAENFKNTKINQSFKIIDSINQILSTTAKKIGFFSAEKDAPTINEGRTNFLASATKNSLHFLKNKSKPFFLMVEAAKIDSYGHYNNIKGVVNEGIDFDRAISEALQFADENPNTLVLITADHETGGLSLPSGELKNKKIEALFPTHDHTATMVPIFAYGVHANQFTGVYDNTEVFKKIIKCISEK